MTLGPRTTISPSTFAAAVSPSSVRMRNSPKLGLPTEPTLRLPGGSGLVVIIDAVSVRPYVSINGAPNSRSRSDITAAGSGADDERRKRRRGLTGIVDERR